MPSTPPDLRRRLIAATVLALTLVTVGTLHRADAATLYGWICRDINYGGGCIAITQNVGYLGTTSFGNDRASSVIVAGGNSLSLYVDISYGGVCQTFNVSTPDLRGQPIGNDRASSVQVGATCPAATLFRNTNYGGAYLTSNQMYPVSAGGRWMHTLVGSPVGPGGVASVSVSPGHSVSLYSQPNFSRWGACITVYSNTPTFTAFAVQSVWVDPPSPCRTVL
jgi:hypothetical protein